MVRSNVYLYFCDKRVTFLTPLRKQGAVALSWKQCSKMQALKKSMMLRLLCHSSTGIFLSDKISWSCSLTFLPTPAAYFHSLTAVSIVLAQLLVDCLDWSFSVSSLFPWWIIFNLQLFPNLIPLFHYDCSSGRVSLRWQHKGRKKRSEVELSKSLALLLRTSLMWQWFKALKLVCGHS